MGAESSCKRFLCTDHLSSLFRISTPFLSLLPLSTLLLPLSFFLAPAFIAAPPPLLLPVALHCPLLSLVLLPVALYCPLPPLPPLAVESLAFTLAVKGPGWHDGYRLIAHDMGGLVASTDASTLHDLLHAILLSLPAHALEFIRLRHPSADGPRTSPPTGRLGLETPETGGTTVPDLIHLAAASVPALRRPPGCPRCNGDAAKCDGGAPQSDSDSCTTSCPPLHQKAFLLQELRDMPLFSAVSSVLEAQHAAGVRHRSGEGSEENGWAVIGRGGSTTGASEGERVKSGAGRRCGDVCGEMEAERIAMLLLLCGRDVWGGVRDRGVRDEVQGMTELTHDSLSMVRTEVDYLRSQLGEVGAMGGTMSSGGTLG